MLLATLLIALVVQSEALEECDLPAGDDLKALCANEPINLKSFEDLESLEAKLKTGDHQCSPLARAAIVDLKELVSRNCTNICTMKKVEAIEKFHSKYLTETGRNCWTKKDTTLISLKLLARAYAERVSIDCRYDTLKTLTSVKIWKLEDEFREISPWIDWLGPAHRLFGFYLFDVVLQPVNMAVIFDQIKSKAQSDEKVYIQTRQPLLRLQAICAQRLKPVYDRVLSPWVRLARIGFSQEKVLKPGDNRYFPETAQWSAVVFLCETLNRVEFVAEDGARADQENQPLVRVLNKHEATVIKNKVGELSKVNLDLTEGVTPVTFEVQFCSGSIIGISLSKKRVNNIPKLHTYSGRFKAWKKKFELRVNQFYNAISKQSRIFERQPQSLKMYLKRIPKNELPNIKKLLQLEVLIGAESDQSSQTKSSTKYTDVYDQVYGIVELMLPFVVSVATFVAIA